MKLEGKKILLGITGGIAAYKCPDLVRKLKQAGAQVRVVLTPAAGEFVSEMSLQAVSAYPVANSLFDPAAELAMGHIELARWADLVLIAPTTADFIARMAAGMGNDLLSTLCLATTAPIAIAPAMNVEMWNHPATQQNLTTLKDRAVFQFGPAQGDQACGEIGFGRMLEPLELVDACSEVFSKREVAQVLAGKKLLITAGPTREELDPVRYITNHSSGKMGYALAEMAMAAGAQVTLVSGPVNISAPKGVELVRVGSALDMHQAVLSRAQSQDIFVAAAAVADYRPASRVDQKIKKTGDNDDMVIELVRNPDILADVAALANKPFCVGFAAETRDLEHYARGKLKRKKLDMICANLVSIPGQGFNVDTNALDVFWKDGGKSLSLASKQQLAVLLVELIAERMAVARQ
ncbi:bifunctional phosphopantothenoylcysteine decarboxylase/phosphopantothenate--cysteine ligase CoaBC [Pelagibaculum spongiae]|uniref:Coenzyme A biosynthesis bifunctional protein CoaBC n=1 Tax=Pelagibaculum spongiae TaxID=2080658 RepID=A0A2V1GYA1_9GAMM|nr:bifunctional phosphopantothenoylcysteine decarboxylase/phosphopantothenate--cysteine ligase CoaBC [Pelagibaculum spongiae]PVZ67644.1 bifunctional phosphopantothenoylcysteine decarboxylase/phosphopantothenate--cysteine ligase CoaBC [Pelagibaculum spongiae]